MRATTLIVSLALVAADPPPASEHAETARWMVNTLNWGGLTTISTRGTATSVGDPFGNPYSFADVGGVPYVYASDLDASMEDAFTADGANPVVAMTLSEAALGNTVPDATTNVTDGNCVIGASEYADPENPPCARLVITGTIYKVADGSDEETAAYAALSARHPYFDQLPDDHSFYVAGVNVTDLWLIDAYGGATILDPADYFAVTTDALSVKAARMPQAAVARAVLKGLFGDDNAQPWPTDKTGTARWMAKNLDWGVLSTISTRSEGAELGQAFGNPYSFADANNGIPYFYASDLDASIIDAQTADGASPRVTFALSEASYEDGSLRACKIGQLLGDPENPPCARLVFSGDLATVEAGSDEEAAAKAALFARHPSFANYPDDHSFFVAKIELDGIWLIDFFGGAADIAPADYYAA